MVDRKQNCSGLDLDDARFDAEFRGIVNALFCACLAAQEGRANRLARELFRRVELENKPLTESAGQLEMKVPEAREILGKIRRDIAVVLALGLCSPVANGPTRGGTADGCGCGHVRTPSFPHAS